MKTSFKLLCIHASVIVSFFFSFSFLYFVFFSFSFCLFFIFLWGVGRGGVVAKLLIAYKSKVIYSYFLDASFFLHNLTIVEMQ